MLEGSSECGNPQLEQLDADDGREDGRKVFQINPPYFQHVKQRGCKHRSLFNGVSRVKRTRDAAIDIEEDSKKNRP